MKSLKILLYNPKSFIFLRNINTSSSICNANIQNKNREITKIHQKSREDKYMFGPMKKKKNKTSEKSTIDLNKENIIMDSELWWNLKLNRSRMNLIRVMTHKIIDSIESDKSNTKNLLLDSHENKVTSKSKKNNIKSKRIKDIKKRRSTSVKKHSKNKKDDSVTTEVIPNELTTPQSKNEVLLNVDIIKTSNFPIFSEQQKIPKILEKSEILSLSLKDDPEILYYPSVTKILSETMTLVAQRALKLWKEKLIREMGEEKFNKYQQELLNNGKAFHSCIEDTLLGREVDIPEHILPAYNSLSSVVNQLQDIRAVESFVSHKGLCYKGKVDCIANFKGKLCVIDWKKSDKDKGNINVTYDAPIQLAAYVGAINSSKSYPFPIHSALIVVGYTTGKPADTFFLSGDQLQAHWYQWLAKLKQYWINVKSQKHCLN